MHTLLAQLCSPHCELCNAALSHRATSQPRPTLVTIWQIRISRSPGTVNPARAGTDCHGLCGSALTGSGITLGAPHLMRSRDIGRPASVKQLCARFGSHAIALGVRWPQWRARSRVASWFDLTSRSTA